MGRGGEDSFVIVINENNADLNGHFVENQDPKSGSKNFTKLPFWSHLRGQLLGKHSTLLVSMTVEAQASSGLKVETIYVIFGRILNQKPQNHPCVF